MSNSNPKFKGLLSLAMKAGKLKVGEGRAQDAIRSGEVHLIILSSDAADNTLKKFSDMGSFRDIPVIRPCDRYELGSIIGREFAVIIAVADSGFADSLLKAVTI